MHRFMVPKIVGAVVLLSALGGGTAWAFTATNTVAPTQAGEGYGAVSGYTVSNVHYTLVQNNTPVIGNDADVSGVSFSLNGPAATAGFALYDVNSMAIGGGTCTNNANTWNWTCTVANNGYAPVYQIAYLDVTAAQ